MKNKKSIGYLRPEEKNWINLTVHNIIQCYQPLLIFFIDSTSNAISQRTIFPNADYLKKDKIHIRLLVVHQDKEPIDESLLQGLIDHKDHSYELFTISMTEMQQKITAHKLFYCWVYREGILQYEQGEAFQLLPTIEFSKKECATQAAIWFYNNPTIVTALDECLNLPKPTEYIEPQPQYDHNSAQTTHTSPISIYITSNTPITKQG